MKQAIAVTGTPGAGKTHFAEQLCADNPDYDYFDLNSYLKEKELYLRYDKEDQTHIIDETQLTDIVRPLIEQSERTLVIDSHLSHYINPSLISLCYVVLCNLPLLEHRLKGRKYPAQKIRDNLDSEIFQVCLMEAKEAGHRVETVRSC